MPIALHRFGSSACSVLLFFLSQLASELNQLNSWLQSTSQNAAERDASEDPRKRI